MGPVQAAIWAIRAYCYQRLVATPGSPVYWPLLEGAGDFSVEEWFG